MAVVIDGKAVAATVRAEVAAAAAAFSGRSGRPPGLATVLVGDDPASATYVRSKRKACAECGIASMAYELSAATSQAELLDLIRRLNVQQDADGILVQLPLPAQLDTAAVVNAIDPAKDVDGLHPFNQGRLVAGAPGLRPCTPLGVMRLVDSTGVELRGARAVVIGRSNLVGKPVAFMLLERHATLTICHSRTRDLPGEVARADVVVAAIGRAGFVAGEWIKPGAVVIDVGINRSAEGKLLGDVDFSTAVLRAGFITPVPGGVGPMTIAMLLSNTVAAASARVESGAAR